MSDEQVTGERGQDVAPGVESSGQATGGIQQIPAQISVTGSPTVAVARDRLVEAIGREAAFLADQRAGQASEGLEVLARAFALVAGAAPAVAATPVTAGPAISGRAAGLADPVAFAKDFAAGGVSAAISKNSTT
ncbi:hypothetical protein AMK16_00170 [Streptomyces sp. CB00455]|uniref:hypothetical protein n=1 Tax=Streptomyces sp. CB00455 TaxID=1703927 RepID=UPI000939BF01|nr:hypothetical protein [Streptomyces sp. CB00455]OKK21762.1 hypothetical protein AMK16_00170 [Streptomyces sp. CB00455]